MQEYFELTFRFDNEDKSLSRFNGLPIEVLAKFLTALNKAMEGGNEKMVISEIKGNCYAPVISTPSITQFERLKTLHNQIEKGNYNGLNTNERKYYQTLQTIIAENYFLNVYDTNKDYYKTINNISVVKTHPHYYETNAIRGILTKIGGRNINSKISIFISSYAHEVEISSEQDEALKDFYRKEELYFFITERINKETKNVENATLDGAYFSKHQLEEESDE